MGDRKIILISKTLRQQLKDGRDLKANLVWDGKKKQEKIKTKGKDDFVKKLSYVLPAKI